MKRKKAMAFNAPGGTKNYIGVGCRNLIDNGCYPAPVTCNIGTNVYCANNGSYQVFGNGFARNFRLKFQIINRETMDDELMDELFFIGNLGSGNVPRKVYYFYGWRIIVEWFDTNAIIDFSKCLDETYSLEYAIKNFIRVYGREFSVERLNNFLLNVKSL